MFVMVVGVRVSWGGFAWDCVMVCDGVFVVVWWGGCCGVRLCVGGVWVGGWVGGGVGWGVGCGWLGGGGGGGGGVLRGAEGGGEGW